jgi:hypothetical protein
MGLFSWQSLRVSSNPGLVVFLSGYPRLAPWVAFFRRFVAKTNARMHSG